MCTSTPRTSLLPQPEETLFHHARRHGEGSSPAASHCQLARIVGNETGQASFRNASGFGPFSALHLRSFGIARRHQQERSPRPWDSRCISEVVRQSTAYGFLVRGARSVHTAGSDPCSPYELNSHPAHSKPLTKSSSSPRPWISPHVIHTRT